MLKKFNLWRATPAIALSIAGLVLVAGLVTALLADHASHRQKFEDLTVQSKILAATVTAALVFDDQKAAQEYVNALKGDPQTLRAGVYGADGRLFAGYARSAEMPVPQHLPDPMIEPEFNTVMVITPVAEEQKTLGSVYIQSITEPPLRRLARFALIALLLAMIAIVMAVLGIAHATLAKANAALEQQSRKLALTNETLLQEIQGREKAEAAYRQAQKMEAIGQLTGGIAHDFNNLLQIVLTSLEMLQRRAVSWSLTQDAERDFRRFVEAAVTGGQRGAALTGQLLAFARRQALEPRDVDVNRLVQGMSDLLRRSLGEAIAIETVLAGGIWRVFIDANQLESALVNLAVNARDAMGGSGKLTIETANAHLDDSYVQAHPELTPGQYVLVAVSDTGNGMTREVLANAFEPFFTTKPIGQGTGLGLSQVYGFIKQSGGHIKIYSELGQGCTIKLYLPRYLSTETPLDGPPQARQVQRGSSSETILIVEDDEDVRRFSVELIRELGYGVFEARNGHEALRILEQESSIRLLFTDIGLPDGLNGRQLADAAQERYPALKVLFTSGYTANAIIHGGRLDPGVALISKPFTYAILAEKLRQVLNPGSGQHDGRTGV